jgi:hypothetical protein
MNEIREVSDNKTTRKKTQYLYLLILTGLIWDTTQVVMIMNELMN